MAARLENKVAVITGTGGSMGRAAALMFCREGASVVGCDINEESARATLDMVQSQGGKMVSMTADLSEAGNAQALMDFAIQAYGKLDVLYNNGAMAYFNWFPDLSYEDFRNTIREEVDIVFHACKAAWPYFLENGGGSIINVGSVSASICYEVLPGLAHSTAKAGVLGMTRHLAMEGGPHQIRANAISPGLVETNQTKEFMKIEEWWGPMKKKLMLGRVGQPEDIAPAAVFLASDESSWVTGANFAIDGGTTAW